MESGELGQWSSAFFPDGRHFLYQTPSIPWFAPPSIWIGSLDSSEQKLVLKGAVSSQFASGHLLFIRNNRIFAQAFDPSTGKLSGEAVALAQAQSYSVSASGVLAFQGGRFKGRLEWFNRKGNLLGAVGPGNYYGSVRISPGGTRILANVTNPQFDLWSYPAAGGPGMRLTFGPGNKGFSVWSPDGKYIAYSCQPNGKRGICRKPADGSGAAEELLTLGAGVQSASAIDWSPDGRYISFGQYPAKSSGSKMWILPLFGDRKPFQVAPVGGPRYGGYFSPDGHWLAYFSYETGQPEVYVVPFPGPGGKYQISQDGGYQPRWDRKGHLYFLSMGNRLIEADLEINGKSVQVKSLHRLFQLSLPTFTAPSFDVTPDGSRFVVITSVDPTASRSIGLLQDWKAKLEGKH